MGSYREQVKRGGLDSSPGFLIKNPEAPHRTTLPSWDKGETQFRVFPAASETGWQPMREGLDDDDFGPAVWSERVAKRLGTREQLTYCTRIPGAQLNPTERFVPALHALIKEKPKEVPDEWLSWIYGGAGRGAKVPDKIKSCLFMQGAEIMRQGKQLTNAAGQPAPQFPALLMASVSVQMSFERRANKRAPTNAVEAAVMAQEGINAPISTINAEAALAQIQGNNDNARAQRDAVYAQAFVIGDWCTINGGRILRIFKAVPKENEREHYDVVPGDVLNLSTIADKVRQLWWPWEKLLRFHTAEEQIQLLCRAFPAEAVDYVFGNSEYANYLPIQARGAWGRYSSGHGATVPGVQVGAPAPGPAQAAAAPAPGAGTAAPGSSVGTAAPTPATPPAAPAAAAFDLSGGGSVAGGNQAGPPIMAGDGFGGQPGEFSRPPVTAPPAAPAPAAPAPAQPGTPAAAVAGGDVDPAKVDAAMAELEAGRRAKATAAGAPGAATDDDIPF